MQGERHSILQTRQTKVQGTNLSNLKCDLFQLWTFVVHQLYLTFNFEQTNKDKRQIIQKNLLDGRYESTENSLQ